MTATGGTAPGGTAPTSILLRTPNWLGDLLMSTAFLQAVLDRFPDVAVDLIVRRGFETLPLPHRGRILPYDKATQPPGRFGAGLRKVGYSHFFVLPPSFSSAWMAFRSGAAHRVGYRGGGRGWLLHPALSYRHSPRSVHLIAEYLDLLAPWGRDEHRAYLPRLEAGEDWIAGNLPGAVRDQPSYILLAPGAEYGPAKQWPIAHFADLAKSLDGLGWRVVVMGLEKDRRDGERILAGCSGGINLCGETDLPSVVALVARAALLVSNDSGAMHIGAALQRPQIALFGSSNPKWTAPLNPHGKIEYLNLDCSPCYKRTCPLGHGNCLVNISPGSVLEAARELLGSGGPDRQPTG